MEVKILIANLSYVTKQEAEQGIHCSYQIYGEPLLGYRLMELIHRPSRMLVNPCDESRPTTTHYQHVLSVLVHHSSLQNEDGVNQAHYPDPYKG